MTLRVYPDWMMLSAESVLDVIESDFGQSGRDVRLEAIRCELWSAYATGWKASKTDSQTPLENHIGALGITSTASQEKP